MATLNGADPTFAASITALIAASGGRVYLKSGVRTNARQTELWNAALRKYGSAAAARKWVAPPGRSNHEKGTAADLGGDLNLAARLAPQFGLYRPLSNEAWHFEPVGSRSGKGASAAAPAASAGGHAEHAGHVAGDQAPAAAATAGAPTAPDPNDRRTMDVQIGAFLNVLNSPVDFSAPKATA